MGENGAGKSTLFSLMVQGMKPSAGTLLLNGENIEKLGGAYRNILGYMPQQQELYDDFTGENFLRYMAVLKGLEKKKIEESIYKVLQTVNLFKERHSKIKTYSGGMKQRLLIAQSLLNEPKILILDEPTAGLDPYERIRIRNFISEIAAQKIVILATHVVSDVENIAKEVMIMKKGRILRSGSPSKILAEMQHKVFEVTVDEDQKKMYDDKIFKQVSLVRTYDGIRIRLISDVKPNIGNCREVSPCLEDLYLYLTN